MFKITPKKIRNLSIKMISKLGYPKPPNHLPCGESIDSIKLRDIEEITARACGLHCVLAVCFGFDHKNGLKWIIDNNLQAALTDEEMNFLNSRENKNLSKKLEVRIEALWTLCWALSYVNEFDFSKYCGKNLIGILPDIEKNETIENFKQDSRLRKKEEIIATEDLAYCLHWCISEERLKEIETSRYIRDYVIHERRHALSWLLCSEKWDDVELDT